MNTEDDIEVDDEIDESDEVAEINKEPVNNETEKLSKQR